MTQSGWGWSLLGVLADLPEIVIQYLFIKLRRCVFELKRRYAKRRNVDEGERNQQRE
jgi:hypothetical protein